MRVHPCAPVSTPRLCRSSNIAGMPAPAAFSRQRRTDLQAGREADGGAATLASRGRWCAFVGPPMWKRYPAGLALSATVLRALGPQPLGLRVRLGRPALERGLRLGR
jgi:hypothetical protein